MAGSAISKIWARQVYSGRGHPAVEATVVTESGASGTAQCTAGHSVGTHEVTFAYDGGSRWNGKGVTHAVHTINTVIADALRGADASDQALVDHILLNIGGPGAKARLGGNAVGAVSAAALKAGANALGIPLYRHIGGEGAVTLPCASDGAVIGSERYLPVKGGKPTYAFIAYDFGTFAEAAHAVWEISTAWSEMLCRKYGLGVKVPCPGFPSGRFAAFPKGIVRSDEELWQMMCETIARRGYEGRVGLQGDIAADSFFDADTGTYRGLFDAVPRTRDELMAYILEFTAKYPFVIIEDPLSEDDFEGHAVLTRETGIQVVGDDLFATNAERVRMGIEHGSCNAVLLKVNQIGSITEARAMVDLAYASGYGVMPCCSRGENLDICDYCVGLNAATIRESCFGTAANRFLEIERELGPRAVFAGRAGLKGRKYGGNGGPAPEKRGTHTEL